MPSWKMERGWYGIPSAIRVTLQIAVSRGEPQVYASDRERMLGPSSQEGSPFNGTEEVSISLEDRVRPDHHAEVEAVYKPGLFINFADFGLPKRCYSRRHVVFGCGGFVEPA
jgi:hypothetical protein